MTTRTTIPALPSSSYYPSLFHDTCTTVIVNLTRPPPHFSNQYSKSEPTNRVCQQACPYFMWDGTVLYHIVGRIPTRVRYCTIMCLLLLVSTEDCTIPYSRASFHYVVVFLLTTSRFTLLCFAYHLIVFLTLQNHPKYTFSSSQCVLLSPTTYLLV